MIQIDTKDELINILNKISKEAYKTGYPVSDELKVGVVKFGKSGKKENNYAWNTPNIVLNYKGKEIGVQPITRGSKWLNKARQLTEFLLDKENRDIVSESEDDRIKRESDTYSSLSKAGYDTLNSYQDLIKDEKISKKVLLTSPKPTGNHIIDSLNSENIEDKLTHLESAATKLKELNHNQNQEWGDASLVNMAYDDENNLIQYNFGFKPNPKKDKKDIMASNFVNLCISGVYRSGVKPEQVVEKMLNAYAPDEDMKKRIKDHSIVEKRGLLKKPIEYLHNAAVYGMNQNKINEIKKSIYVAAGGTYD